MERVWIFDSECKMFARLCDKLTLIENRQAFFDLNAYLNNVQVMLTACNRYLKWVVLDRCRKPLRGGPTLAGLPGGAAGELSRLFPVQCNYEYPLAGPPQPAFQKDSVRVNPLTRKEARSLKGRIPHLLNRMHGYDLKEDICDFFADSKLDVSWD